ncbi:MAG: glycosyltransferase family 4 protein [Promethearchaeota archaeon]
MKILLITYDFYPNIGGVAYTLKNICSHLRNRGYSLYIFNHFYKGDNIFNSIVKVHTSFKRMISFLFKKKFYNFTAFAFWTLLRDRKTKIRNRINRLLYLLIKPRLLIWMIENLIIIYPRLKKLKFDFVFGGNTRWCLPLVYLISRFFNKKVISIAYGTDFLIGNSLGLKTYYFKDLDKIIVICDQMKQLIKRTHQLNEKQIEVINAGINVKDVEVKESKEDLRKEFNISQDQFVILGVGRHDRRKNFELVIQAVYEIKKTHPSIKILCYFIGEGEQTHKLKNLTKALNLDNIIKFLGFCDFKTRNKFYKLSDVFVMPSSATKEDVEGFGIVFLEANYHKIPVIGTSTGGIIDAIVNNETGLLVKPNNLSDLVEKILTLYNNEDLRKNLGEKGYKRVLSEFTWDKIIQEYEVLFNHI